MNKSQNNQQQTAFGQNNQPTYETIFCSTCGEKIAKVAISCPHCGSPVAQNQQQPQIVINNTNTNVNQNTNMTAGMGGKVKNKWVAFFLCLFLGYFGAHKFYEGKTLMGIVYIFTMGLFCIGWFIDIFTLLFKPNPYFV